MGGSGQRSLQCLRKEVTLTNISRREGWGLSKDSNRGIHHAEFMPGTHDELAQALRVLLLSIDHMYAENVFFLGWR